MTMDVSTLAIRVQTTGVTSATGELKQLEQASASAEKQVISLADGFKLFGAAVSMNSIKNAIGDVIRQADAWQMMQAKLDIATGSMYNARQAQQGLFDMSQRLMVPMESTAQLYTRLVPAMRQFGKTSEEAMQVTNGVALALKLSGATGAESASVMLQFSQAMQSGRMNGAEFNAVAEGSPLILNALSEKLGKTRGELKKLGSQGKLTTDVVTEAIQVKIAQWEADFAKLPVTVDGAMTRIRNAFMKAFGEMNQATGVTKAIANALVLVADNAELVIKIVGTGIVVALGLVIKKLYDATIGSALYTIALERQAKAALVAATSELNLAKAVANSTNIGIGRIGAITKVAKAEEEVLLAQKAVAANTSIYTKVVQGLTSALGLLLSPIGLITAAVLGIAAVLYLCKDKWVEFGDTQATVGDWIKGTWKTVSDFFLSFYEDVKYVFDSVYSSMTEKLGPAYKAYMDFYQGISDLTAGWFNFTIMLLPKFVDKVIAAFKAIGEAVSAVITFIISNWDTAFTALGRALHALKVGDVDAAFEHLKRGVAATANNTLELTTKLKEAGNTFMEFKPLETMMGKIGDKIIENTKLVSLEGALLTDEASKRRKGIESVVTAKKAEAEVDKHLAANVERLRKAEEDIYAQINRNRQARLELTAQIREQNKALEDEYELGMMEILGQKELVGQKERLNVVRAQENQSILETEQATLKLALAQAHTQQGMDEEIDKLSKQILLNDVKLKGLDKEIELREKLVDLAVLKDWKKDADAAGDFVANALMDAFERGKGGAKSLWESLKNMFKEKLTVYISTSISNAIMGQLSGQNSSSGISSIMGQGGGLSNLASLASNFFSGGNMFGGATGALSSFGMSAGGTMGNLAFGLSEGLSHGLAGIGTSISQGFAGIAGGNVAGGVGSLMGAAGAAMPYVAAAVAIYKYFKGKEGGPKSGGEAFTNTMTGGASGVGRHLFTPNQSDEFLGTLTKSVSDQYSDIAKSLGIVKKNLNIGIGFDTDPKGTAQNRISTKLMDDVGKVLHESIDREVGRDSERLQKELNLETGRMLIAAIRASDLPNELSTIFANVDIASATEEQINLIKNQLAAVVALNNAFTQLGALMPQLANLSYSAKEGIAGFAGGLQALSSKLSAYYEAFYTDTEKLAVATQDISAKFNAMGVSALGTKESFRALVESQDLTTESGQRTYAALLEIAPAFADLIGKLGTGASTTTFGTTGVTGAIQEAANTWWKNYGGQVTSQAEQAIAQAATLTNISDNVSKEATLNSVNEKMGTLVNSTAQQPAMIAQAVADQMAIRDEQHAASQAVIIAALTKSNNELQAKVGHLTSAVVDGNRSTENAITETNELRGGVRR